MISSDTIMKVYTLRMIQASVLRTEVSNVNGNILDNGGSVITIGHMQITQVR